MAWTQGREFCASLIPEKLARYDMAMRHEAARERRSILRNPCYVQPHYERQHGW